MKATINIEWKQVVCFLCFLLVAGVAFGQATGDYRSVGSGNWNVAATWERFDGVSWVGAVASPTSTDGVITIRNGHTVTVTANVTVDQVVIAIGGQVTLNVTITLNDGSGVDLQVAGTLLNDSGTLSIASTSSAEVSGTYTVSGSNGSTSIPGNGLLTFLAGGTYRHTRNGGSLPPASKTVWAVTSTCEITGVIGSNGPGNLPSQTFGNFIWNNPGQTGTINFSNNFTDVAGNFSMISTGSGMVQLATTANGLVNIGGNFIQSGGTLQVTTGGDRVVTVSGNFSLSSGILDMTGGAGQGTLNVAGTFSHAGGTLTETSTNVSAKGIVVFNGSSNQAITATGTISNSVDFTVNNASGITLASDFVPPNVLTLTNGNITTGAFKVVIGIGATTSRTSGHIVGALQKNIGSIGPKSFEVGTSNGYTPVLLNVDAGLGNFTVRTTNGAHPNSTFTNLLQMYWTLSSAGITQADITFNYLQGDVVGDESQYLIGKYDGTWSFPSGTVNSGSNTASVENVTSFSDWTLGESGSLPVELVSFDAIVDGSMVHLLWKTASETNNAGFQVEHLDVASQSKAGTVVWRARGFVEGHGTTAVPQTYSYDIEAMEAGYHRFRLKQIDYDGTFTYSPEVEVAVTIPEGYLLSSAYPNPFNPATQFTLTIARAQHVRVEVYDGLGRWVALLHDGILAGNETHRFTFNADGFASGIFIIRAAGASFSTERLAMLLK